MYDMKLLTVLGALCAFPLAKGKISWVPDNGGANVSLKKFLNTSDGVDIYTLLATSETRHKLCKLDHVWNVTKDQVFFTRTYTPGLGGAAPENLIGTFFDETPQRGPTIMLLRTTGGADRGVEELVYQDDNNTCGIFWTAIRQIYAGQWYDSCELRVKSSIDSASASPECIQQFFNICSPERVVVQTVWPQLCVFMVSNSTILKTAVESQYLKPFPNVTQ
ncbi:uncharacterized protein LOC119464940 [Dermacentor silvarum]|uniref:uncharacterized protein LOC119464940 n=1 Tax=Dermacentor silvarum TaxID=543639 RepID=UPI002100F400|nr:uncharacterized protein LOC119464940 [Dermacentor silvarum]